VLHGISEEGVALRALADAISRRYQLQQSSRTGGEAGAWPVAALVDEMLAMYVEWREHADTVASAYARWCAAPPRLAAAPRGSGFARGVREQAEFARAYGTR